MIHPSDSDVVSRGNHPWHSETLCLLRIPDWLCVWGGEGNRIIQNNISIVKLR